MQTIEITAQVAQVGPGPGVRCHFSRRIMVRIGFTVRVRTSVRIIRSTSRHSACRSCYADTMVCVPTLATQLVESHVAATMNADVMRGHIAAVADLYGRA